MPLGPYLVHVGTAVVTVTHLHAVLRKAFRDAVMVDELISSNPVEQAKRPARPGARTRNCLDRGSAPGVPRRRSRHRLFAFFHVAAYTGARRGELLDLRGQCRLEGKKTHHHRVDSRDPGERVNGTTKSGRTRVVSIDDGTVAVLRQHKADQTAHQLRAGDSWRGGKEATYSRPDGASRSTPTP